MSKIVYQTDAKGFYAGPVEADESPLEPGVWLIPAGCVEVAPPAPQAGKVARWRNGRWDMATPPSGPVFTPVDPVEAFRVSIDAHVTAAARSWGYNSAESLASYAASTIPEWAAEAQAFIEWRDAVWSQSLAALAEISAGTRPMPENPDTFIAFLPAIVRPTS